MTRRTAALAGALFAAAMPGVNVFAADDPAKTQHDTYCIMCHDTQVYTREARLARNYDEVREQVNRWQTNLSLQWSDSEIDRMTTWLITRYYKF